MLFVQTAPNPFKPRAHDSIVADVLSNFVFADAVLIVTAAGLALVALGFLVFILNIAVDAAQGYMMDREIDRAYENQGDGAQYTREELEEMFWRSRDSDGY